MGIEPQKDFYYLSYMIEPYSRVTTIPLHGVFQCECFTTAGFTSELHLVGSVEIVLVKK